jgi:hypothetical protein
MKKRDRGPNDVLQYTIPPGQYYVSVGRVDADWYWSPTQRQHQVVRSTVAYYRIVFNHRFAFVKASNVRAITLAPPATPTPLPTETPTPVPPPTETPTPVGTPTPSVEGTIAPQVTATPTP